MCVPQDASLPKQRKLHRLQFSLYSAFASGATCSRYKTGTGRHRCSYPDLVPVGAELFRDQSYVLSYSQKMTIRVHPHSLSRRDTPTAFRYSLLDRVRRMRYELNEINTHIPHFVCVWWDSGAQYVVTYLLLHSLISPSRPAHRNLRPAMLPNSRDH